MMTRQYGIEFLLIYGGVYIEDTSSFDPIEDINNDFIDGCGCQINDIMMLKNTSSSIIVHSIPTFGKQLDTDQLETLSHIFIVTATLSFLGSGSVIFLSIKRRVVTRRNILPLFHIFVADLLVSIGVITGAASNRHVLDKENLLIEKYRPYCVIITIFTTACFMATFLLTINYALQSYIMISERLDHPHSLGVEKMLRCCNWEKWFPIFSWLFPACLGIFITFIDSHIDHEKKKFIMDDDICTWCFPLFFYDNTATCSSKLDGYDTKGEIKFDFYYFYKAIFLVMIALTLVIVLVLFYFVSSRFRRVLIGGGMLGHNQRTQVTKLRNRTILLFSVLLICWIIPLSLGLVSVHKSFSMRKYFPMYVVEALTSPLQGFLNSIVYGWFSVRFRTTESAERRPLIQKCASPDLDHLDSMD